MRPVTPEDDRIGGLFVLKIGYSHKVQAPPQPCIRVVPVTTAEQLEQVRAIRAVVFMGEQKCPYAEEFDGNDACAQHILGYVGDEPAGCARIRYFGDFAKIERLSVLSQYRRTKLKYQIVEFVENLVRQKGFNLIYGHPQKRILSFWTKLGYEVVNRNFDFHYSDHDYAEMRKCSNRIRPLDDAFRPDGSGPAGGTLGTAGHSGPLGATAGDKALLIGGPKMGIVVNSKRRELTGPEIAGYIADMLPEMSRMARDHNMAGLAESLDRGTR